MDKRFSYDSSGQAREQQARVQAALEMEEALFLQRSQELRRDLQLRRFLLQEQIDQQSVLGAQSASASAAIGSRSLYDLPFGAAGLAAQYEQELFLQQEHLRRQQLVQAAVNAQLGSEQDVGIEPIVEAEKRTGEVQQSGQTGRKRSFDSSAEPSQPQKRSAHADSVGTSAAPVESEKPIAAPSPVTTKTKAKAKRKPSASKQPKNKRAKASAQTFSVAGLSSGTDANNKDSDQPVEEALQALVSVGTDLRPAKRLDQSFLTIESLVMAAEDAFQALSKVESIAKAKIDEAAETISHLKSTVVWVESEDKEDDERVEIRGFKSILPRLPNEPTFMATESDANGKDGPRPSKSLTDVDYDKPHVDNSCVRSMTVEYPYPVDSWWPSISAIRKERRAKGEAKDEEDFADTVKVDGEKTLFRSNLPAVRKRLANDTEPGVLEKLPHCRIHRMFMKRQHFANAPDHAFCWQVTENYCNHPMVCCSICSTWRHAACGGHYKQFTVREMIEKPFVAVCDHCHIERQILEDYPRARERIERQRVEHLRRGLATSAVIRQAAFAKHGGAYKWPLGSVPSHQIGGHIRSVHSRHDKAEKQWSEMATRLIKGLKKDRAKTRTRELERLLAHVEDAEGATDRHNMVLFLQRDVTRKHPIGYEKPRKNIFDPAEYRFPAAKGETIWAEPVSTMASDDVDDACEVLVGRKSAGSRKLLQNHADVCNREGCRNRPRFDSEFCSDGCGVAAMETDLLRSLEFASEIHPSFLR